MQGDTLAELARRIAELGWKARPGQAANLGGAGRIRLHDDRIWLWEHSSSDDCWHDDVPTDRSDIWPDLTDDVTVLSLLADLPDLSLYKEGEWLCGKHGSGQAGWQWSDSRAVAIALAWLAAKENADG